jgi:large subunit ribosomal protein L32
MSVPKKRRTSSSKKRRASHFALGSEALVTCSKCKKKTRPHRVCEYCGFYKGKEVIAPKGTVAPVKKEKATASNADGKKKEEKKQKEETTNTK